jgi:hypothetical protein
MYEQEFAKAHTLIDERYAMRYPGTAERPTQIAVSTTKQEEVPVTWMSVTEFAYHVGRNPSTIYTTLARSQRLAAYSRRGPWDRWQIDSRAMGLYDEGEALDGKRNSKRVLCRETGEIFPAVYKAAAALKVPRSVVSQAINWGRPINGYHYDAVLS